MDDKEIELAEGPLTPGRTAQPGHERGTQRGGRFHRDDG